MVRLTDLGAPLRRGDQCRTSQHADPDRPRGVKVREGSAAPCGGFTQVRGRAARLLAFPDCKRRDARNHRKATQPASVRDTRMLRLAPIRAVRTFCSGT